MTLGFTETLFQVTGLASLLIIGHYRRLNRQNRDTSLKTEYLNWESKYFRIIRFVMGLFYLPAFVYALLPIIEIIYPLNQSLTFLRVEIPLELRWLGVLGVISSTIFLAWTTKTLGPNFSPSLELRANHQLVTRGPYQWIRHPMYVGNVIWIASFTLLSSWWIFTLYLIIFVLFIMILRTPREEQMMLERFGEQYKRYMNQTGRFFPKWNK